MQDVFARIGRGLEHLTKNGTTVGAPREELDRIINELKEMDAAIDAIVREAVTKAVESAGGQLAALEARCNGLAQQNAAMAEQMAALAELLGKEVADQNEIEQGLEALADQLDPQSGNDTLEAGAGNDLISADEPLDEPVITAPMEDAGAEVAAEIAAEPVTEEVTAKRKR